MQCKTFKEQLRYEDGNLYWLVNKKGHTKIGEMAGSINHIGRLMIMIDRKLYQAHRIVFYMHYGYFPKCVDHIDGNPLNNRIENLREATLSQNQYNRIANKNNTSGIKGVSWDKKRCKWRGRVQVNKKEKAVGYFDTVAQAAIAVQEYRSKAHGGFARHG